MDNIVHNKTNNRSKQKEKWILEDKREVQKLRSVWKQEDEISWLHEWN
jgi:hypothetical protein